MRNPSHAANSLRNFNAFISEALLARPTPPVSGLLTGLRIAVKDNICTSDFPTTCGSRGLEHFRSPYDATVVRRIRDAGGIIVGKTNMDEFGMGSHSTNSAFGAVRNKIPSLSAGGSSGGSAVAVATGQCQVALGTDTGGSVRLPAAYNGIYGFKPSYGLLPRWGVVAYANSLDTVGLLSSELQHLKSLFRVVCGYSERDQTSISTRTRHRLRSLLSQAQQGRFPNRPLRIGVPAEYSISSLSPAVRYAWRRSLLHLQRHGHSVHAISLPTTRCALSSYYVLAPAEASSNLAKYDSVRFGSAAPPLLSSISPSLQLLPSTSSPPSPSDKPLYATTRQYGFSPEVRRRILLGTYSLSAEALDNYFLQAQRVRRLVQSDFDSAFALPNILIQEHHQPASLSPVGSTAASAKIDVLLTPTSPTLPPELSTLPSQPRLSAYADDVFTVPASLAGLPALSVPIGIEKDVSGVDSVGLHVVAQYGDDDICIAVADALQELRAAPRQVE